MIVGAGFFGVLVMASIGGRETPQDVERRDAYMVTRKAECVHAMMSSIGHSTVGYADKIAYDRVVHEKCEGFALGGKAL